MHSLRIGYHGARWLFLGLFLALAVSRGQAQILLPRISLDYRAGVGGVPGVDLDPSMVTATSGPLTESFAIPFTSGSASADYDRLSLDIRSSGTGESSSFGEISVGSADFLTINASGSGYLRLNFDFSGDFAVSGGESTWEAQARYLAQVVLFQNALFLGAYTPGGMLRMIEGTETTEGSMAVSDFSTSLLAVDFKDPVELHLSLFAETSFNGGASGSFSGPHEANAGNLTLSLASIEIFDAGGQALPAGLVTRASSSGNIIPEPSRAVMLLLAAFALAGTFRYRCAA